ncbi:Xylose isomerase-like TIM barrel [Caulifigura coniformis]|uniref:Xylose isomerase-like TIM barrel n=1 Tax=Caulifigura coniformis TaxID=2527983 RepID=A0A517S814_9PLAN|nr:sugar phosphate isomerase/epimerase family protein [Caulifigura coniformis]QDT52271.1 Xylose isomerase-like TIM barrel [Caulifigura coniformis]
MSVSRRQFLASAAVAAALPARSLLQAADPIVRNGKPYMKLSLAAYSFNKYLPSNRAPSKTPPRMTLEQFVDYCASLDLEGTELTSYYFPKDVTPASLNALKAQTHRLGLDISGTSIGNDFCLVDGPERDAQLKLCRDWIDHSAALGAPVIRIFAGKIAKGDTEAKAVERCVAGIEQSLEYAAEKGVALALENHGGITATPAQLLGIVKAVKPSPWFGINFDSGNFRTPDPYSDLEQIAPYAINAQVKVSVSHGEKEKKQPADFGRIVEILKAAKYRGYLALEYEEPEDPWETIPGLLKTLRGLIG